MAPFSTNPLLYVVSDINYRRLYLQFSHETNIRPLHQSLYWDDHMLNKKVINSPAQGKWTESSKFQFGFESHLPLWSAMFRVIKYILGSWSIFSENVFPSPSGWCKQLDVVLMVQWTILVNLWYLRNGVTVCMHYCTTKLHGLHFLNEFSWVILCGK